MAKKNSNRRRKTKSWAIGQQTVRSCRENIKKKIKKAQKEKILLNSNYLNSTLNCVPSFIGCYSEDQIDNLVFGRLPCFLIVNIDSSNMPGSHWITLGIFQKHIEVFDPLGFNIFNWSRVPCNLISFIHRLSVTRKILISKRVQSDTSNLCGFYCLFYLFLRKTKSMRTILSFFYTELSLNDNVLLNFFT